MLIVKLDAMGDVLRTTCLLPGIAHAHPGAAITWLTRPESVPLIKGNPYVAETITYGPDAHVHLLSREFDRVINLDAGKISAGLATLARAPRKDGFVLHRDGYVVATNPAARAWLATGIDDQLKRRGRRTYQSWMKDIIDASGVPDRYVLELSGPEREKGRRQLAALGVDFERPIVGLNTGAGGRWELKQWREQGFIGLVQRMARERDVQFVLLGGPGERERNARLQAQAGVPLIDPGCDNPVRHFAALTAACDVVVTGDTLAMHIALALGRRTVVLFGPTSAPEIELYGLGEKVDPGHDLPELLQDLVRLRPELHGPHQRGHGRRGGAPPVVAGACVGRHAPRHGGRTGRRGGCGTHMMAQLTADLHEMVAEQGQYRDLLYQMTMRDLRLRYKQTVMGFGWAIFMPLVNTAIFSVIFMRVAPIETGVPYVAFAYCGLLTWNFFASSLKFAVNLAHEQREHGHQGLFPPRGVSRSRPSWSASSISPSAAACSSAS